jgi:hypothetical protein
MNGERESLANELDEFLLTIQKMPSGGPITQFLYKRFHDLLVRSEQFLHKDTAAWESCYAVVHGGEVVRLYVEMEVVLREVLLGLGRRPGGGAGGGGVFFSPSEGAPGMRRLQSGYSGQGASRSWPLPSPGRTEPAP